MRVECNTILTVIDEHVFANADTLETLRTWLGLRILTVVTQRREVVGDQGSRGADDEILVNAASEAVPSVPTHLRSQGQAVVECHDGRESRGKSKQSAGHGRSRRQGSRDRHVAREGL